MIDWEKPQLKWSLISAGVLCFLIALFLIHSFSGKFTVDVSPEETVGDEGIVGTSPPPETQKASQWVVYVTGSVKRPGVYEVPSDSRVHYAVEMAGGFSAMADPEGINLAEKLSDGAHIKIPSKGETVANGSTNVIAPSGASATSKGRVDINRATVSELQALPGVGPKTAEAVIANREAMGRFVHVDDLMRVKGIGSKRMEQLRELVTVGR